MPYRDAEKRKAKHKEWSAKNPHKIKEYREKWAIENPEYSKTYASKNKEKLTKYKSKWYLDNAERISKMNKEKDSKSLESRLSRILRSRKSRAKKMGIEFDISAKDIEITEFCPLLGVKLEFSGVPWNPNGLSVDRIDPKKGYIKGNVWIISYRANRIKNDASLEELLMISQNLKNKMYAQNA
jgi:hypothetical protein